MYPENYELLTVAIIERSIADYVNYVKRACYLKKRKQNISSYKIRPRREGESRKHYRQYKYLHSAKYIQHQIEDAEEIADDCREFLLSDWLKLISTLDGEMILEELNRQLKITEKD